MGTETEVAAFEEKVAAVVEKATSSDKGTLVFNNADLADVPAEVQVAAKAELRYRNTQKGFTKAQQALSKQTKVSERLTEELTTTAAATLSTEQVAELEGLKGDPDAYAAKKAEFNEAAQTTLSERLAAIDTEGTELSEVEVRQAMIAEFAESTGTKITQALVDDHVPPVWTKKLEKGEVTFAEYLAAAAKFIKGEAVIQGSGDAEKNDTNLGTLSGGSQPSTEAQAGDIVEVYENTIFQESLYRA